MTEAYKCANCGAVTTEKGHLCEPRPVTESCDYCGESVENARHMCKPMRAKLEFQCGACGRPAESEDVLCKPQRIPD